MIRRFMKSREVRKLLRNRLALVSLAISGLYLTVGLAVLLFGLITLDDTEVRVGMDSTPGFGREVKPEERFETCDWYLTRFERLLKRKDVDSAIAEWDTVAYRKLAIDADQLEERVDEAIEIYEELEEEEDLDERPELESRLAELETIMASFFVTPSGFDKLLYDARLCLGTDRQGRSILVRGLYSIKVAVQIGLIVSLIAVTLGSLLGCAAAFFGGWVDHLVIFLYSTLSSIPNLVLLTMLAFAFTGSSVEETLIPVYVAFCATFWIGPCRVIRGETLKLKELEYVQAATAVGFGRLRIMVKHIIPTTAHLMFVNFSLLFVGAIKGEVILSFLGLGVKKGPSWGIMISASRPEVLNGFFWQIGTATVLMFGLVLSFNILTDALQDAFDPKHAG